MTAPPIAPEHIRRNQDRRAPITVQTRDRLVADTCRLLSRAGVRVGPSKISRIVRSFDGPLTVDGAEYIAHLAAHLQLTVQQRSAAADQYRNVIAYRDDTGEEAVAHVMRQRGY